LQEISFSIEFTRHPINPGKLSENLRSLNQKLLNDCDFSKLDQSKSNRGGKKYQDLVDLLTGNIVESVVEGFFESMKSWLETRNRASFQLEIDGWKITSKNISKKTAATLTKEFLDLRKNEVKKRQNGWVPVVDRKKPKPKPMPISKGITPETTLVVGLGADEWPKNKNLDDSPAFGRSAEGIRDYILDEDAFGIPSDNCLWLFNVSFTASRIDEEINDFLHQRIDAVRSTTKPITDIILYYVGHGFFHSEGLYFLSIKGTPDRNPQMNSLEVGALHNTLSSCAGGLRRYLIVDACYSGATGDVVQDMGVPSEKLKNLPDRGTVIFSATDSDQRAVIPEGANMTLFTSALLKVLRDGDTSKPKTFCIEDLSESVLMFGRDLFGGDFQAPQVATSSGNSDLAKFPLIRNVGFSKTKKWRPNWSASRSPMDSDSDTPNAKEGEAPISEEIITSSSIASESETWLSYLTRYFQVDHYRYHGFMRAEWRLFTDNERNDIVRAGNARRNAWIWMGISLLILALVIGVPFVRGENEAPSMLWNLGFALSLLFFVVGIINVLIGRLFGDEVLFLQTSGTHKDVTAHPKVTDLRTTKAWAIIFNLDVFKTSFVIGTFVHLITVFLVLLVLRKYTELSPVAWIFRAWF
jgi:hypothetical protein